MHPVEFHRQPRSAGNEHGDGGARRGAASGEVLVPSDDGPVPEPASEPPLGSEQSVAARGREPGRQAGKQHPAVHARGGQRPGDAGVNGEQSERKVLGPVRALAARQRQTQGCLVGGLGVQAQRRAQLAAPAAG